MTPLATRVRATGADALLVTKRRARQDTGLLVGTALLLLVTLVLTLGVPRLLERTADEAVRQTIRAAGTDADLIAVPPPVIDLSEGPVDDAYTAAQWLESQFGDATEETVVTVRSGHVVADSPAGLFALELVHVATPGSPSPVRWVAGTAPSPALPDADEAADAEGEAADAQGEAAGEDDGAAPDVPTPATVEVGLSTATAAALDITLADGPYTIDRRTDSRFDHVVITGLYEPVDAQDQVWVGQPGLLGPITSPSTTKTALHTAAYVPVESVDDMVEVAGRGKVGGTARAAVRTEGMSLGDAHALTSEVMSFAARTGQLSSGLPQVVAAFDARMSAARAQASLVVAGVASTAALCLVLAASLLVARRRPFLVAERARGASIASILTRALLESVPVVVGVGVIATGAVLALLYDQPGSALLAVSVGVVAALAPAVLAAREAAQAWTGRRVPADRRVRAAQRARRGVRRLVAEALVVLLAVAAVVSVRGRGLIPLGSGEVDPLLAAAPVLLASAAALVVVRVSPAVVRAAGRWVTRSRGLAAPLAVARAHGATTAVVPLLTVTVAVALVVMSGTLVHTIRSGQHLAADQLVGAPVRLDGLLDTEVGGDLLGRLAADPGVTVVATGTQLTRRAFGEFTGVTATLLVVDAAELAEARRSMGLPVDDGLATLGEPGPDGSVPALVSAALLERAAIEGTEVLMSGFSGTMTVDVRGTTDLTPDKGEPVDANVGARDQDDGLVVVDRDLLADVTEQAPRVDRAWVSGPGAVAAVEAPDVAPTAASGIVVTTRDGWWTAWSQGPLTSALTTMLVASVGVLAALSVLALVLVVVATARERGRTLSALRTLGLDARTARWATLGELAPLVLGGLVGGVVIGLGVPALIGDALGLTLLTAEPEGATVDLTWWPVAAAVVVLLLALVVAVAAEQAVRRRDRLGEVLRVGER
ncbi:MAG: hypothetical protein IR158_14265 [Cellulomonas sp.]|uniref:FtsX-like permease family protein n=1 Tax=Cellulomonas sp. TaxID=40001 RepID=UPI0019D9999F|nr:FtsX-like permease family protein [Cellulomonas sp.]MBF0688917.1 hypothetical protein [Cellulomonas sp.]